MSLNESHRPAQTLALSPKSTHFNDDDESKKDTRNHYGKTQSRSERDAHEPCVLGVASMSRAHHATTVTPVLSRIGQLCGGRIHVQWLDEDMLRAEPALWHSCDILWTLWSPDLPLEKLKAYVDRVEPLELNEVAGLMTLTDRMRTLQQCVKWGIPVPRFIECLRNSSVEPSLEDSEDYIVIDGERLDKPFVEKPIDSTDHDIYVYYPRSAGGGRVRLGWHGWGDAEFFGGRARVRRSGSYVYERFIPSEGFELRLFVVGSTYVHGEAKQQLTAAKGVSGEHSSPQFIPVSLEAGEKQLARRAALAFGQRTFHIFALRTQEGSGGKLGAGQRRRDDENVFVHDIDVENGGMPTDADPALIEDIAAGILAEVSNHYKKAPVIRSLLSSMKRSREAEDKREGHWKELDVIARRTSDPNIRHIRSRSIDAADREDEEDPLQSLPEDEGAVASSMSETLLPSASERPSKTPNDLLAVLAVMRHGDRTPKQKIKLKLQVAEGMKDASLFLGLVLGWIVGPDMDANTLLKEILPSDGFHLRSSEQMKRLHDLLTAVIPTEPREPKRPDMLNVASLPDMSFEPSSPCVSAKDRSVSVSEYSNPEKPKPSLLNAASAAPCALRTKEMDLVLAARKVLATFEDVHAKLEIDKDSLKVNLKCGGQLTRVGATQARNLGRKFRKAVYPTEDMAHMHASLRHDLKVHSSNEPRCAQTAAAFAQGLLSLESPLGAVQVSFVRMDGLGRLDGGARTFTHSPLVVTAKVSFRELLESGDPIDAEFKKRALCVPEWYQRVQTELEGCQRDFGTVRAALEELASAVKLLAQELKLASSRTGKYQKLLEVLPLVRQRWEDNLKDILKGDAKRCPADKVAAILDHAKYDMRHSMPMILATREFEELVKAFGKVYSLSSSIASYAELGEYGTTPEEKFEIARAFLRPMLRKLRWDLRVASGAELGEEEEHLRRHNELFKPAAEWSGHGLRGAAADVEQPVRSRLYFAHHSQMQTLVNLFRWAPGSGRFLSKAGQEFLAKMHLPLGYLTHLVLKLWRRHGTSVDDRHYMVSLELSPGDEGSSMDEEAPVAESALLHEGIPLGELDKFLSDVLADEEPQSAHRGHARNETWVGTADA